MLQPKIIPKWDIIRFPLHDMLYYSNATKIIICTALEGLVTFQYLVTGQLIM